MNKKKHTLKSGSYLRARFTLKITYHYIAFFSQIGSKYAVGFYINSYNFVPNRDMLTIAAEEGKQTEQNQNRISKIPFGCIRKKLCFRFLFDCLFFRSIVRSVGTSTCVPFLQSLFHCIRTSDTWWTRQRSLPPAPRCCEVKYYKRQDFKRSQKIYLYISRSIQPPRLQNPRLRNGIPVIILDPVV